jgi:hypothetical protein
MSFSYTVLTPNMPLFQLWCAQSKSNMDLKTIYRPKSDDEKWSRKKYFEIPQCALRKLFSNKLNLLQRKAQSYKFSIKNGLICAWRDFNKTFCGIFTYHK